MQQLFLPFSDLLVAMRRDPGPGGLRGLDPHVGDAVGAEDDAVDAALPQPGEIRVQLEGHPGRVQRRAGAVVPQVAAAEDGLGCAHQAPQLFQVLRQRRQVHVGVGKGQGNHLHARGLELSAGIRRAEVGIDHVDIRQRRRQRLLSQPKRIIHRQIRLPAAVVPAKQRNPRGPAHKIAMASAGTGRAMTGRGTLIPGAGSPIPSQR